MRHRIPHLGIVSAAIALLTGSGVAQAQTQTNDTWANRTVISSLPFSVNETQIVGATVDADDPVPQCLPAASNPLQNTVWYSYTTGPQVEYLNADAIASTFTVVFAVYTGTPGSFRLETGGCAGSGSLFDAARVSGVRLQPNTEYTLFIGSMNNVNGGTLTFQAQHSPLYPVTKTDDTSDGACDADCSLREAITAANAVPGAVLVPAGTYTITRLGRDENAGATGDFDITCSMGIYGAGMNATVLDAAHADRVVDFDPGNLGHCTLTLADLSLVNGTANSGTGAALDGGGLRMALGGSAPFADFLGLERVRVSGNQAAINGAGLMLLCPAQIRDSRIDHNVGALFGGGLAYYTDPALAIEISGSTFDNNTSPQEGAGALLHGSARITNSTFSNNHAGFYGGGIEFGSPSGSLFIGSSTIAYNTASTNPNATDAGGGLLVTSAMAITLQNSVFAANSVANPTDPADCTIQSGTLMTHHDHIQRPGLHCANPNVGDVFGSAADLNPELGDNGGPTPTHMPLGGSALIDAGDPAGCKDSAGRTLAYDQRGAPYHRDFPATCDKGAVEFRVTIFADGLE